MSLKNKIFTAITSASAIVVFGSFAAAQDKSASQPNPNAGQNGGSYNKMGKGNHAGHGEEKFLMRGVEQLNLTDAQKQQTAAVFEKYRANVSPAERDEMRSLGEKKRDGSITPDEQNRLKTLKKVSKTSSEQMRADIMAILTPAQKQQLEQTEADMRKKAEERRRDKTAQTPTAPPQSN